MPVYKVNGLEDQQPLREEAQTARTGWVEYEVRPETRDRARMFQHLGDAMGKQVLRSYADRASNEAASTVWSWLAVADANDIAVFNAQGLSPKALSALATLTTSLNITTWLIFDHATSRERQHEEQRLSINDRTSAQFLAVRSAAPRRTPPAAAPAAATGPRFPAVPATPFPGFLIESQHTLSDTAHAQVSARYRAMADITHSYFSLIEPDANQAGRMTVSLADHARDANELQTDIAGIAAGAFRAGYDLRVDLHRFGRRLALFGASRPQHERSLDALHRLFRPADAAICALAAMGLGGDDIAALDAHHVADDGSGIRPVPTAYLPSPDAVWPILAAQHIHRFLLGGSDTAFVKSTSKGGGDRRVSTIHTSNVINDLQRETGIRLRNPHSPRTVGRIRWKSELGIQIRRIA